MGTDGDLCRVGDCIKPAATRGLCQAHYAALKLTRHRDHAAAVAAALAPMTHAERGAARRRARADFDKPGAGAPRRPAAETDPVVDARIETATTMAAALKLQRIARPDGFEFRDPRTGTSIFLARDGTLHEAQFTVGHTIRPSPDAR